MVDQARSAPVAIAKYDRPVLVVMAFEEFGRLPALDSATGRSFAAGAKPVQVHNAPVVTPDMTIPLVVQREPDQGTPIDEPVVFGLAVTRAMLGEEALYDEVYARMPPPIRAAARP